MGDKNSKLKLADVPDLSKLEEHGVSIGVPTPKDFVIANPWAPAGNGAPRAPSGGAAGEPADDGPETRPADDSPASED
jgi:hypothetical protein